MTKTLLKQAQDHLPAKSGPDYKSFLKTFYERVPKEDVEMMAPENLAYTAQTHLKMTHERPFGKEPAITIHTPTLKNGGWDAGRTIIDIVNDDMAFLVDSVVAEIIRHNYQIAVFIHPILHVERSGKQIKAIHATAKDKKTEGQSHIHVELNRIISKEQCDELEKNLHQVLSDARFANRDWQQMRSKINDAKKALDHTPSTYQEHVVTEYKDFLDYLHNFPKFFIVKFIGCIGVIFFV